MSEHLAPPAHDDITAHPVSDPADAEVRLGVAHFKGRDSLVDLLRKQWEKELHWHRKTHLWVHDGTRRRQWWISCCFALPSSLLCVGAAVCPARMRAFCCACASTSVLLRHLSVRRLLLPTTQRRTATVGGAAQQVVSLMRRASLCIRPISRSLARGRALRSGVDDGAGGRVVSDDGERADRIRRQRPHVRARHRNAPAVRASPPAVVAHHVAVSAALTAAVLGDCAGAWLRLAGAPGRRSSSALLRRAAARRTRRRTRCQSGRRSGRCGSSARSACRVGESDVAAGQRAGGGDPPLHHPCVCVGGRPPAASGYHRADSGTKRNQEEAEISLDDLACRRGGRRARTARAQPMMMRWWRRCRKRFNHEWRAGSLRAIMEWGAENRKDCGGRRQLRSCQGSPPALLSGASGHCQHQCLLFSRRALAGGVGNRDGGATCWRR